MAMVRSRENRMKALDYKEQYMRFYSSNALMRNGKAKRRVIGCGKEVARWSMFEAHHVLVLGRCRNN